MPNQGPLPHPTRLEAANCKAVLVSWSGPKSEVVEALKRVCDLVRMRVRYSWHGKPNTRMFIGASRVNCDDARYTLIGIE